MPRETGPDLSKDENNRINNPDIAQEAAERTSQKMAEKEEHERKAEGFASGEPGYRFIDSMGGPDRYSGDKEAKKWQKAAAKDQREIDRMDDTVLREARKASENKQISRIRKFLGLGEK